MSILHGIVIISGVFHAVCATMIQVPKLHGWFWERDNRMLRIGVVNEVSACMKNKDIVSALETISDIEVLNFGMKDPKEDHPVTYIQTGIMSAVLLNCGICDLVVGGCGTGQGYLNAVMQFPGVFCGLIQEPLDAWLFSQINGGNCISLALNKGYGWAADVNLKYIFERLFMDPPGRGYPVTRAESQKSSRNILADMSVKAHRKLPDILRDLDEEILAPVRKREEFLSALEKRAKTDAQADGIYRFFTGCV